MERKIPERISGLSSETKLIFLIIFVVAGTVAVQYFSKNREKSLLGELKSAQYKEAELNARLNETITSIQPLKNELDNLRRVVLIDKTIEPVRPKYSRNLRSSTFNEYSNAKSLVAAGTRPLAGRQNSVSSSPETKNSLQRLKGYIREIEERNDSLVKRSQELTVHLKNKEAEAEKLNRNYIAVNKNLESAISRQRELEQTSGQQVGRLKEEVSDKDEEIRQALKLKFSLESVTKELSDKIGELTVTNSSLKGQLKAMAMDNSLWQIAIDDMREELRRANNNTGSLQQQISQAAQYLLQKEKERQELSGKLQELQEPVEPQVEQPERLKPNKKNKQRKDLAPQAVKSKVSELTSAIQDKDGQINDVQNQISTLKEELDNAQSEREWFLSSLRENESAAEELRNQLNESKESQEANLAQLKNLQEVNASLKENLQEVVHQLELLKTEKDVKAE